MGMAPIIDGLGLILVITSYDDYLTISVTSCPDRLPDVEVFEECLRNSFARLQADTVGTVVRAKPRRKKKKSAAVRKKTAAARKPRSSGKKKAPTKSRQSTSKKRKPAIAAKKKRAAKNSPRRAGSKKTTSARGPKKA